MVKCSDALKSFTLDQSAESINDMVKLHPHLGVNIIRRIAQEKVESGEWVKLMKREGKRLVPAYKPRRAK